MRTAFYLYDKRIKLHFFVIYLQSKVHSFSWHNQIKHRQLMKG